MATKWKDLKHKSSPEVQQRVDREALAELERIGFERRLSQARQKTQVMLAEWFQLQQTDFHLSSLRGMVDALGGRLELRAVFPDVDFGGRDAGDAAKRPVRTVAEEAAAGARAGKRAAAESTVGRRKAARA